MPLMPRVSSSRASVVRQVRGTCFVAGVLILLVGIGLVAYPRANQWSSGWLPLIASFAAALPFFALATDSAPEPGPMALGAASTLAHIVAIGIAIWPVAFAIFVVLELVGTLVPPVLVLAYMWGVCIAAAQPLLDPLSKPTLVLLVALCAVAIALRRRLTRLDEAAPTEPGGRLRGSAVALVYIIALVIFVNRGNASVTVERTLAIRTMVDRDARAEHDTRRTIRRAQFCLEEYRRGHPGEGYPLTLDAIDTSGANCQGRGPARGENAAWPLRYAPNAADSAGLSRGYWIVAESTSPNNPQDVLYATESGALLGTKDWFRADSIHHRRQPSPAPLPPANGTYITFEGTPVAWLLEIRSCLLAVVIGVDGLVPGNVNVYECRGYLLTTHAREVHLAVSSTWQEGPFPDRYRVNFDPFRAARDTIVPSFTISARPMRYGVDGLRSYLVDTGGVVHWTLEDRAATATDPIVPRCESRPGNHCRYFGSVDALEDKYDS
jgi:hypothetical protein